jgi:hypothetical protein
VANSETSGAEMSADDKRHDQLTTAPKSTEHDAEPRIDVSKHDGATRIDIRDDAEFRPGSSAAGDSPSDS